MDPYLGEIRMFGGNFAPVGWAFCNGQLLAISENDALFTLLGTQFGGDGQSTFGLPDLRGRVPIHQGSGFVIGQSGGAETVTLTASQLPAHSHSVRLAIGGTPTADPSGSLVAAAGPNLFATGPATTLSTSANGGSQPHDNMAPFLGISFIIALFGIFPSQT
jgi:microcystin-dependent protein